MEKASGRAPLRVAIAGFGTIGTTVALLVDGHERTELVGVVGRDRSKTEREVAAAGLTAPVLDLDDLPGEADVVVEAAPPPAFESIARPVLEAGRVLATVSAGALIEHPELVELAAATGGRIVLATGALLGLDAVRAAALGRIESVTMVTVKPARAFVDVPYVRDQDVDLDALEEPICLFKGSAREGVRLFPTNVNVAVSLALAGVGPDETQLEVWADPELERNTHRIEVVADAASFQLQIQNVPTERHPSTGRITALSLFDAVLGLISTVRIGS